MGYLEATTWLFVGAVVTAYIASRHADTTVPKPVVLDASREVDITRWRHDGLQPPNYGDYLGNRARYDIEMGVKV